MQRGASRAEVEKSWKLSLDWAKRSQAARRRPETLAFGIVQGGMYEDLRIESCRDLVQLDFDGYSIGGLSVGEEIPTMRQMTEICCRELPWEKPRYLMGVGMPIDILESVALGIDMFDCVIPTRSARFGRLFVGNSWINIRNEQYRRDPNPIDSACDCYTCKTFSRAYISHLIHAKEVLAVQLASLHNLRFYQRLLLEIREQICAGTFLQFKEQFLAGNWA